MSGNVEKVFVPHELKTIEVDVEKKLFLVNGEPFGEYCTGFSIWCEASEGYRVRMEINAAIHYAEYSEDGEKQSEKTIQKGA